MAAKSKIKHLFLASGHPKQGADSELKSSRLARGDSDWDDIKHWQFVANKLHSANADGLEINVALIDDAVARILRVLSPTLITLSLHCIFLFRPSLFPRIALPALKQLFLYGPYGCSLYNIAPATPCLDYLYLSSPLPHFPSLVEDINANCPALSGLHITENTFGIKRIESALGISRRASAWVSPAVHESAARFPASLRAIFIGVEPNRSLSQSTSVSPVSTSTGRRMETLAEWAVETSSSTGVSIHVVPEDSYQLDDIQVASLEWENAVIQHLGL